MERRVAEAAAAAAAEAERENEEAMNDLLVCLGQVVGVGGEGCRCRGVQAGRMR